NQDRRTRPRTPTFHQSGNGSRSGALFSRRLLPGRDPALDSDSLRRGNPSGRTLHPRPQGKSHGTRPAHPRAKRESRGYARSQINPDGRARQAPGSQGKTPRCQVQRGGDVKRLLADINIQGLLDILVGAMQAEPWKPFWDHLELQYLHFADIGLVPESTDVV